MASKTKVIIAGAGIAGPILAVFLKLKGYEPIVYERTDSLGEVGQSLWYALLGVCRWPVCTNPFDTIGQHATQRSTRARTHSRFHGQARRRGH